MGLWFIPVFYAAGAIVCGLVLPRLEHAYIGFSHDMAPGTALVFLGSVTSGMIALTGIVFSIAYVTVQFNAIAYSPRLALWSVYNPPLFHALGVFIATFFYGLATLVWVDRAGSGSVPLFSSWFVVFLLILSMMLFARLIRGLGDLQITSTLHMIGDRGRAVIRESLDMGENRIFERAEKNLVAERALLGPVVQTVKYSGAPRCIGGFDTAALVRQALQAGAVIEIACAVGDTLADDTLLLRIYGAAAPLSEAALLRAIRLVPDRTFEQDAKYPIRLLVDVAIKALSPAINDPTTAVQAIDQIEDLLRRLGRSELDGGYARDAGGVVRLIFPVPSWEDFLGLAFDEIRQYGAGSVQVMRRLRAALAGLAESVASGPRAEAVQRYLQHLDRSIERSPLDPEDRVVACQEDRQGLGVTRRRTDMKLPANQLPKTARPQAL